MCDFKNITTQIENCINIANTSVQNQVIASGTCISVHQYQLKLTYATSCFKHAVHKNIHILYTL